MTPAPALDLTTSLRGDFAHKCFSQKIPTHLLAYPHWGGGDSAEGTQNFQKGRQATPPPPWGRVSKPLKKRLGVDHLKPVPQPTVALHLRRWVGALGPGLRMLHMDALWHRLRPHATKVTPRSKGLLYLGALDAG